MTTSHVAYPADTEGTWSRIDDRLAIGRSTLTLIEETFERTLGADGLTRRHWQVLNTLDTGRTTDIELVALHGVSVPDRSRLRLSLEVGFQRTEGGLLCR